MLNSFFQSCSQSMFQPSFVNLQLMCIVDKSSRKIMDSRRMKMEDELKKSIKDWIDYQNERQAELEKKYPPNPPNDVCKDALVKGILIENSFNPKVGELNELFETEYEKLSVWTHDKDENSAIVINVDSTVKGKIYVVLFGLQYSMLMLLKEFHLIVLSTGGFITLNQEKACLNRCLTILNNLMKYI